MKPSSPGLVLRYAEPLKALVQRGAFAFLALAAIILMLVSRIDPLAFNGVRVRVVDAFAPVLAALSQPVSSVSHAVESVHSLANLREENTTLRAQVERLKAWQDAGLRLNAENKQLREQLKLNTDPTARLVTARVVANPGGGFVKTLIVTAGARDGVQRGQAVLANGGLVGRVVDVGRHSSRVLLITDLNSRIPVLLESSRHHAVLAGSNGPQPELIHLPPETVVAPGERISTSGHGGFFPAGLALGVVATVSDGAIRVEPAVDLSRLEFVQIMDYALAGLLAGDLQSLPVAE